jgi:hypothetical protein
MAGRWWMLLAPSNGLLRRLISLTVVATLGVMTVADAIADESPNQQSVYISVPDWDAKAAFGEGKKPGVKYKVNAEPVASNDDSQSSASTAGQSTSARQSPQASLLARSGLGSASRSGCLYDDWAFVPADATSGLQCIGRGTTVTRGPTTVSGDRVDPAGLAAELEGEVQLPNIHIRMNPALGLVNVPTWFWVEGYHGEVLPLGQTVGLRRVECHTETVTSGGDDGAPATSESHTVCVTHIDYLTVEVRLYPTHYAWQFGDGGQQQVACSGEPGGCGDGLGQAYQDLLHPSPIAHPYGRSSLHVGGAYPIDLAIDFAAQSASS